MKRVSIGIIGCGAVAHFHAQSVLAAENASLAGFADTNVKSAEAFAKEYGSVAFPSVEAMLASEAVDAVCICTPSGFHKNTALAALGAGKHILVEKPLAVTVEDCDLVIAQAKKKGLVAGVISQFRFTAAVQFVKRLLSEEKLGKIITAELLMKYNRSQEYYDSSDWRGTWALDGGAMMNQGIHGVDMLLYLVGPAVSASGYMATLNHKIEAEDTAVGAVQFACGALGVIQSTTAACHGEPRRLCIVGTKGTIVITEDAIEKCEIEGGDFDLSAIKSEEQSQGHKNPMQISCEGHKFQIRDFADAVLTGKKPAVLPEDSRRAVALIQGIYESGRSGKAVVLDA